ncbi:BREX system Lon protease-like protein BrxL [Bacillus sp. NPDC094106]|uniref:BREX system Lon protease-like protein BrxL n=1 Tax=Bacillus sp. NPDC094106 TaxID=3363949 RepID=UPI0038093E98
MDVLIRSTGTEPTQLEDTVKWHLLERMVPLVENNYNLCELGPRGTGKSHIYTVARGKTGMIGTYKLETEVVSGNGKFEKTGLNSDRDAKESIDTAFRFFKANNKNISGTISTTTKDYLIHIQDIHGVGLTSELSLVAFIALCSGALNKPVQSQMVVLGSISISGTMNKIEELANVLQVCFDSGAKKILLPMTVAVDIPTVPLELFAKF